MTDIPIIFECQVAGSWRHKFDLWRHRCDTVSFMSVIHPKYSTEMHQNTTFYAELIGEHAGEGFMPLRWIVLMLSTREVEKSWILRKFDLWHAITGSNIDLGPKIIPPIASTRREQSAGLFREALRRFVWKRQGGRTNPPPLHRRRWQNTVYGRGLNEIVCWENYKHTNYNLHSFMKKVTVGGKLLVKVIASDWTCGSPFYGVQISENFDDRVFKRQKCPFCR